jgi:integrase
MCGTGIEWGAAIKVRRADINPDTRAVHARGSKTAWRNREVRFLDDWCWRAFWEYAVYTVAVAPVFELDHKEALAAHHEAVVIVGADPSRLHDWRHTFAVRERRRGTDMQIIKHQLGHAPNSTLAERVYGAYTPDNRDYDEHAARIHTDRPARATQSATRRGRK